MFKSMDTDNNGTITYDELKRGLEMQGADLTESEVQQLMESVWINTILLIGHASFFSTTTSFLASYFENAARWCRYALCEQGLFNTILENVI